MKKHFIYAALYLLLFSGCSQSPNEESTEEQALAVCLESIKEAPKVLAVHYSEASFINTDTLNLNALSGSADFLIEDLPGVEQVFLSFAPATPLEDFRTYPEEWLIVNSTSNKVGIEYTDSIYYFINAENANSWYLHNFFTSTAQSNYKLTVTCECPNGARSPEAVISFRAVNTEALNQGIRLFAEAQGKKMHYRIYPFSQNHGINFFPGNSLRVYAETQQINSSGEVIYSFVHEFEANFFHQSELLDFSTVTGLPESLLSLQENPNTTILTMVKAEFTTNGDALIDSPYPITWPRYQ